MKIRSFRKSYEGKTVLELPELTLAEGRIYAVVGANGSGKSTLAKVLSGVEKPDDGLPVLAGCQVGFMPQKSFAFRMSVENNLLISGSDRERAQTLMEALHIAPLAHKPANRLSGGETARMALARALMAVLSVLACQRSPRTSLTKGSRYASRLKLSAYSGQVDARSASGVFRHVRAAAENGI